MTDGHRDRGLSSSASLLLIFVGFVLAVGTMYSAAANTTERVVAADDEQRDRHETVALTGVNVTSATWDSTNEDLTVRINNTGDTTLSVSAADTLVDGTYVGIEDFESVTVAGHDSEVWPPGEQLVLEDQDTVSTFATPPDRVKFVTETGVSDTRRVA